MTDIEIRPATLDDLDGLTQDSADLFAEDGVTRDRLRDPEWPRDDIRTRCAGLIAAPDALVLVAVEDDTVIGHVIGTFSPASSMWTAARAELVSTHVAVPYRGQGIGGRLVEDFTAWGRERGAVRLHVSAYTANDSAIRFYQRYGFVPLSIELALDVD
ncbi:GNAT family N-acetyltransferase [Catenulispora sp. NF23]|uniref:GNAT family N-acetyltransferase n=1 Tax=Catenulispora pinistramenti TaxID=2705254 RepID=UPI001BACEEAC|nr:GNAT family N-acetyltransferase [Catenulispora pinistramenti]MBS2531275.1 GNAT family N-acetyltransferase [Catenulispora pinistramenti]